MTDTYADGFLDGWATAAETLRTRFHLTARDAATGPRIDAERLGDRIGHSDLPEGKPGSWAPILGHPKLMREALCVAQHAPGLTEGQSARLGRLIDACDQLRPIGTDGKHGNRHTPWCGCDDVPPEPEGRPWFVGPQPSLVREQVANTHAIDLRGSLDCHQPEAKRNGPLVGAVGPAVKPQAGYVSNSSSGYGDAADEAGHSDPPEGKPWLVGPQEPLRVPTFVPHVWDKSTGGNGLMVAGACMHCGWAMP